MTGMSKGESSEVRTEVKDVRALFIIDSGRWKEGEREEIMLGVRRRTEGLSDLAWRLRWACVGCGRGVA